MATLRETGEEIFRAALEACSVGQAFARKVREVSGDVLELEGDGEVDLAGVKRVLVVAMGKGAAPMMEALLGYRAVTEGREVVGVLVSPMRPKILPEGIAYFAGGHPSPNAASMEAARAVLKMLREANERASCEAHLSDHVAKMGHPVGGAAETFCFFLISGGASAMVELPLDESIMLDELVGFHRALVHSGGSITEINCVRKHFSAVKGGRLALAAAGLRSLTMVVSDVPAGQLDVLASGPTLPDTSTMAECRAVLEKYDLMARFPESVRKFFLSSMFVESPKPGEVEARVYALLSSDDLAAEAGKAAEQRGFAVAVDNTCDDWEYEAAAEYLLGRMRELRAERARVCLISAGEVTVRLPEGGSGEGGRNQHFALYSALRLGDGEAVISAGSDGIDGNSPAAGAAVDRGTVAGRENEARRALDEFSSYGFLREAGAVIMTGPSGNNLRDLRVLLAES